MVGMVIGFIVPVVIIVVVVWAIRRGMPARRDAAEEALRGRLARGEIDMAEFQVRLRALKDRDAS
ncbi:MAG: hypothetical protein ABI573_04300, partial [Chloroflexota bacterium]